MTRDPQGRRQVSARAAVGLSVASLAAGFGLLTQVMAWFGLPSPAQYHTTQAAILKRLDSCATASDVQRLLDAVHDIDRRLRLFGITDEEIGKRMRGGGAGGSGGE